MISGKGFPAAAGEDAARVAGPLGSEGPGRQAAPCLAGSASGAASGVPSPSHTLRTGAKRSRQEGETHIVDPEVLRDQHGCGSGYRMR